MRLIEVRARREVGGGQCRRCRRELMKIVSRWQVLDMARQSRIAGPWMLSRRRQRSITLRRHGSLSCLVHLCR